MLCCTTLHHSTKTGVAYFGRWDDMVGNPHRTLLSQRELFELKFLELSCSSLNLLLKLCQQFPVEQLEAAVAQSRVPSPPLKADADALESDTTCVLWVDMKCKTIVMFVVRHYTRSP